VKKQHDEAPLLRAANTIGKCSGRDIAFREA